MMKILDKIKGKNKKDNTSLEEIQQLYSNAMSMLDKAKTTSEKEEAIKYAEAAFRKMNMLSMERENEMFATLERELASARNEFAKTSMEVDNEVTDLEERLRKLNNTPAARSIQSKISDFARKTQMEMFDRQYEKLQRFKRLIDSGEKLPDDGRYANDIYDKLSEYEKKYLFLPYLLEKESEGLLSEKEAAILEDVSLLAFINTGNFKNGYKQAVENLHAIGVINIGDEACFMNSFDKYCPDGVDRNSIANYADFRRQSSTVYKETQGGYGSR